MTKLPAHITQLTGIRTEQVAAAGSFAEVFARFLAWCGPDCELYAWSGSDRDQLLRECEAKGIAGAADCFRWIDFQKVFMRQFGFERLMSLKNAVTLAGLDFQGRAHGALADAKNTAALYLETKNKRFRKLVSAVNESHREMRVSLGSLFDFAAFAV